MSTPVNWHFSTTGIEHAFIGGSVKSVCGQVEQAFALIDHPNPKHRCNNCLRFLGLSEFHRSRQLRKDIVKEVTCERERQIKEEGWQPRHDRAYVLSELAWAAAWYAAPEVVFKRLAPDSRFHAVAWPWHDGADDRDKHTRRRQLVIAAAFIVAEIERLDDEGN